VAIAAIHRLDVQLAGIKSNNCAGKIAWRPAHLAFFEAAVFRHWRDSKQGDKLITRNILSPTMKSSLRPQDLQHLLRPQERAL
jgi:hypothetical protein